MSHISKLARNGSNTSVASSEYVQPYHHASKAFSNKPSSSSVDSSSHHHLLSSICRGPKLQTWLQESIGVHHRHERIAVGSMSAGIALMTKEMMEMHLQQAPEIRGILGGMPAARPADLGLRQKLRTWPVSHQQQMLRQKLGTWPLTRTEVLLAQQNPVSGT